MERKQIEGQWWPPENRDSKVPGTLVIEEDRIELSLLGALRDHRASAVAQENPDGSTAFTFTEESMEQDGVYPRILGEAGGKAYTLEDCFQTRRTNLFGGGLQTQRVNVHSVFEGLHFDPEEPVEFSEIVVKLDGLVMFVQRSGLSETIETRMSTAKSSFWVTPSLWHQSPRRSSKASTAQPAGWCTSAPPAVPTSLSVTCHRTSSST